MRTHDFGKEGDCLIIAAYAGVGKTTFCEKYPNDAIDVICMPFKYSNFYEVSKNLGEDEDIKAHEGLKVRANWYLYYYWVIKYLLSYCLEKHIVIPTIDIIMDFLERDHIPYTVVYPDISLKDEYENRYRERGNNQSFLDVFIDQWDYRIENLRNRDAKRIELKAGEYLSDVIDCSNSEDSFDGYVNSQLEKFKNSMKRENKRMASTRKFVVNNQIDEQKEDDRMQGILYMKPFCEDDTIEDLMIIESKQQLMELLEEIENDYRSEPRLVLLKNVFDEDGYNYVEMNIQCKDLKNLTLLL